MPDHFKDLAYTGSVRQVQAERASPAVRYQPAPDGDADRLGEAEEAFLAEQDTFFMATVGETGWPYVQHRGGPPGFVHVLDERTLGFADVRGNRQYISTGNLRGDDRVAMIFVDFVRATRLKVLGRARTLAPDDAPDLAARLTAPGRVADGAVEHLTVVEVAGLNWNCPKHITRRLTAEEVRQASAPLLERIRSLEEENALLRSAQASQG